LDRSGSMKGEKLNNSKLAIKRIIDNLTAEDHIHLVVYDDAADVIFENGDLSDKGTLHSLVDRIKERGSTNLCAGVEKAKQILSKQQDSSSKRIFLFSDGRVNVGIQDRTAVCQVIDSAYKQNIDTTSFGIGDDFDEDLMKAIAEAGHSYYFYIESADQIDKYVSAALGALLGIIGKNAVLKIRGKNGGIVTKIHSHPDIVGGAKIGDLKQDNLKNLLGEIDFAPTGVGKFEFLSYELSYISNDETEGEIKVTGTLQLPSTEDEKTLIMNDEVLVASTIQKTAAYDEEIVKLLESGKHEEALKKKQEEILELEKVINKDKSNRIDSALKKAQKSEKEMKEKPLNQQHHVKQAKHHAQLKRMDSADFLEL